MTGRLSGFDRLPAAAPSTIVVQADGTQRRLRRAAVAICVIAGEKGEACFVLTRRAAGLRAHASQWALPGGRIDAGEAVIAAAVREVREEINLRPTADSVLGVLDDYATRSGFLITPVVIWCDDRDGLMANAGEVASIHLVPLAELDHPDAPMLITILESDAPVIQMPINGQLVHAPTGAILLQFREIGLHGRVTRVNHYEQPTWAWG
jgi:8-oxo-dGTP pyrophosphatase MutT (NUDIX family)